MKQYIVDAFTDKVFHGNPAAVCLLGQRLSEHTMIDIASENHLSEATFTVKEKERHHLRWFTPGGKIDLCGHARLATAFVLMNYYEGDAVKIVFDTMSGELTVVKKDELYEIDLPAYKLKQVPVTKEMTKAIGIRPAEAWMARDLVCVLPNAEDVVKCSPDLDKVKELP